MANSILKNLAKSTYLAELYHSTRTSRLKDGIREKLDFQFIRASCARSVVGQQENRFQQHLRDQILAGLWAATAACKGALPVHEPLAAASRASGAHIKRSVHMHRGFLFSCVLPAQENGELQRDRETFKAGVPLLHVTAMRPRVLQFTFATELAGKGERNGKTRISAQFSEILLKQATLTTVDEDLLQWIFSLLPGKALV